eukprot:GFUD01131724.1.p1 GENE.GFUD01131724.1~~GFUD01131724.1.p1  ORF type:complete len:256 (-),score=86.36 GFUD01131724.1:36-803(-)
MASFNFKREKEKGGKFQFGFNKLRNVFGGSSINTNLHTTHQDSDQLNRLEHLEYSPHTPSGYKQSVRQSQSCNPMSAGQDTFFTRNKPVMQFSSSVPAREDMRPDKYKKNVSRHPTLAFSKSLPSCHENKATQTAAGKEMTQNKVKLSRSGQEMFARDGDKLRRKAQTWRNDLVAVKKRKEDFDFNLTRYFDLDDQLSLRSDESNVEDHIYEEIDNDISTDDEKEEDNFLLGISLERQNNLKFYGCAGWDFGNGS